jgi:hypothetical protein
MEEEGIGDILPNQLVDTNTIPKLRLKLLPKLSRVNILNKHTANNQGDTNKVKENGHLNNLLKHTISLAISPKDRMGMGVTE